MSDPLTSRRRHGPTLLFVCPFCRATRGHHTICCGIWPLAIDLDDESPAALVAGLGTNVINRLLTAPPDQ